MTILLSEPHFLRREARWELRAWEVGCGCPQGAGMGWRGAPSARGSTVVLSFVLSVAAVDHGGCTFQLVEENGIGDGKLDFLSFSPEMVAEQFTLMDAVSIHLTAGSMVLCPSAISCSGHRPVSYLPPFPPGLFPFLGPQRDPSSSLDLLGAV